MKRAQRCSLDFQFCDAVSSMTVVPNWQSYLCLSMLAIGDRKQTKRLLSNFVTCRHYTRRNITVVDRTAVAQP